MIHLVLAQNRVINRVNGPRPVGYPFPDHEWLVADGDLAAAQIGWVRDEEGVLAPPPLPPVEEAPAEEP